MQRDQQLKFLKEHLGKDIVAYSKYIGSAYYDFPKALINQV